jgi:uncharacterized protein YeaO (DUF488 family)
VSPAEIEVKERAKAMIKIKRANDTVDTEDGVRFLVDRLWPRGIKKDALKADSWLKNVAPSAELRQWFGHDPAKWNEFRHKYFSELKAAPGEWGPIVAAEGEGTVTLVYSANDEKHNNAVALAEFLKTHLPGAKRKAR